MTLSELKQYRGICAELRDLETKIHKSKVCDTVSGSDADFPYTKHTMCINGLAGNDKDLLEKKRRLLDRKEVIDEFINNIDDITTMFIFKKRFVEGKSWVRIALSVKGNYTAASVKMRCYRYLKKFIKN